MTRRDLDPAELGAGIYPWLNSVVVPRPIAWVSSRSPEGVDNLAPHSFFTVAGVDPPVLSFTSVGEKDSLRNVVATGEFVISLCTEALIEKVNLTGTDFPPDISEFDAAGLTREPSLRVAPPRVAESPVAAECRLLQTVPFGSCTVVFGQVVHLAIDEAVLRDGRPAIDLLRPVARLGANEWSTIGEVSERRRVPFREIPA
ncbi:MAG: flavin reductase [Frankiales bacterium]|nr:flavin reductase [Frankiales bacterium]MCW2585984.1 flavin reductase [Frankiales bacterium]